MPSHVLLVDDELAVQKLLATVLRKEGFDVTTASNGAEALDVLEKLTPDVVITDVNMPKLDGWSLVRILRSRPATALTPVIFLTALGSDEDRILGFRLGADDYLQKPLHVREFVLRLQRVLERSERSSKLTKQSVQSPPKAGISGSLEDLGLASLLVLLDMEKKSGELTLSSGDQRASLFLHGGQVVRAEMSAPGALRGMDCVLEVFPWSQGEFSFVVKDVPHSEEIQLPTSHLLMECARILDERRQ
jgi:DNA-binding response OmpR family regulator